MDKGRIKAINALLSRSEVAYDEPMQRHTTFRIGGPAELAVWPDENDLVSLLTYLIKNDIQYTVLGLGSNVLVSDRGIDGVTVIIGKPMSYIRRAGKAMVVGAGTPLAAVSHSAAQSMLTGLEFAGGIPGTIGGACVMNAGAYGGEMKNVVESIRVFDPFDCQVKTIQNHELDFGYRHSVIPEKGYVVLEAMLRLSAGSGEEIKARMDDYARQRMEKQPLDFPSAGSTFKRPEGRFAGQLIQQAGLRGLRVGDAQVSEKHCGFVINRGSALAADVRDLIGEVTERVEECHGVKLEPEIKFLGEF